MPFPFDKYPWINFHELNLAYFIVHFREIFEQWDQLYHDLLSWKDATDADLAEWKSTVEAGISSWETGLMQSMEDWKDQTETDISSWEAATLAALDAWKTATTAIFEQIRTEAADSAQAAAGSATAAQTALAGAQTAQAAAETAAAGIQSEISQILTNTADIADLKTQLETISVAPNLHWELGKSISSSGVISDSDYYAITDLYPVSPGDKITSQVSIRDSGNIALVSYIAQYSASGFISRDEFTKNLAITVGDNVTNVRFFFGRLPSSEVMISANDIDDYWAADFLLQPASKEDIENLTIVDEGLEKSDLFNKNSLNATIINADNFKTTVSLIEGSYYDTRTGEIKQGADWKRSPYLPCPGLSILKINEADTNGLTVTCVWYNSEQEKIGAYTYHGDAVHLCMPPKDTRYVGIDVPASYSVSSITVQSIRNNETWVIDYPFESKDKDYYVIDNAYINSDLNIAVSSNYKLVCLMNLRGATHIYQSYNINNSVVFFDKNLQKTKGTYSSQSPTGRLYDVPSDAVGVMLTFSTETPLDIDGDPSMYYVFLGTDIPRNNLSGKKGLVVGDSITYIDGQSISATGNTGCSVGYQGILRKSGAVINSLALNGRPYSTYDGDSCLYNAIVTDQYDLSAYDFVVLFGGANDVRLSVPLGDVSEAYNAPNLDPLTFAGAIGGIINHIRTNFPTCKIFICTTLQSQDGARYYLKNKSYRDSIMDNATFWDVPVVDMFSTMNATPNLNWSTYFYDGTHPNSRGMKRIGKIIKNTIDPYLE